jgi:AcrR family transcriptional regulator
MTATAVVSRAGVSPKTFYHLFRDRDDCFLVMIDDCLARLAAVAAPAYERERSWPQRRRALLLELLEFVEREPEIGALVVSYLVGVGPSAREPRAGVLELLQAVVAEGRSQALPRYERSPLAAEFVVGGALSVLQARLQAQPPRLDGFVNDLMWMLVLPYLGPAAAGRELRRAVPRRQRCRGRRDPLHGLDMCLTQRTAKVLEVIADAPGASNVAISMRAGSPTRARSRSCSPVWTVSG